MPVVHLTKTQEREARVERVLRIALVSGRIKCSSRREIKNSDVRENK